MCFIMNKQSLYCVENARDSSKIQSFSKKSLFELTAEELFKASVSVCFQNAVAEEEKSVDLLLIDDFVIE